MQITIQQDGGSKISRRRFKVANGHYENAAYNDGGVASYFVMVAFPDDNATSDYLKQFEKQCGNSSNCIVLGFASDEAYKNNKENPWEYLQELAVSLAEIAGLDPKYTQIDIFKNNYQATLYGVSNREV